MNRYVDQASGVFAKLQSESLCRDHVGKLPGGLDFISNDYLGLSRHHEFRAAAHEACAQIPPGASASRLLGGHEPVFEKCEEHFSRFKKAESSLLFSSGYSANESIIMAITRVFPLVHFFSDEWNHASTIHGLQSAKSQGALVSIFQHQDLDQLQEQLRSSRATFKVVCTESIFSMHGTRTPVHELVKLCEASEAFLVLDEAHAIGVIGEQGVGGWHGEHPLVATLNTCGKALACQGAVLCGPQWLRQAILNFARPYIYSTAPSPWMAAAIDTALHFVKKADRERQHVRELSKRWSRNHESPIVMWPTTSNDEALRWGQKLLDEKIQVGVVRQPTVPHPGLRISIHAHQTDDEHQRLRQLLSEVHHG